MKIELLDYEKDVTVNYKVGDIHFTSNLDGYSMTDLSRDMLKEKFYDYQIEYIAQKLAWLMETEYFLNNPSYDGDLLPEMTTQKQPRYTDENGKDLIDKWEERYSIEEFRVLMWAMIEKYNERLGKKDDIIKEVTKIADYSNRWLQAEKRASRFNTNIG